jgi:CRP-like cAMP-binding protein
MSAGYTIVDTDKNWTDCQFIWAIVNACINIYHVTNTLYDYEKVRKAMGLDDLMIREEVFTSFSLLEFKHLMDAWQKQTVAAGTKLMEEGHPVTNLKLIVSGNAVVSALGETMFEVKQGNFVGELAFFTGNAASATVTCTTEVSFVEWDKDELLKMMKLVGRDHKATAFQKLPHILLGELSRTASSLTSKLAQSTKQIQEVKDDAHLDNTRWEMIASNLGRLLGKLSSETEDNGNGDFASDKDGAHVETSSRIGAARGHTGALDAGAHAAGLLALPARRPRAGSIAENIQPLQADGVQPSRGHEHRGDEKNAHDNRGQQRKTFLRSPSRFASGIRVSRRTGVFTTDKQQPNNNPNNNFRVAAGGWSRSTYQRPEEQHGSSSGRSTATTVEHSGSNGGSGGSSPDGSSRYGSRDGSSDQREEASSSTAENSNNPPNRATGASGTTAVTRTTTADAADVLVVQGANPHASLSVAVDRVPVPRATLTSAVRQLLGMAIYDDDRALLPNRSYMGDAGGALNRVSNRGYIASTGAPKHHSITRLSNALGGSRISGRAAASDKSGLTNGGRKGSLLRQSITWGRGSSGMAGGLAAIARKAAAKAAIVSEGPSKVAPQPHAQPQVVVDIKGGLVAGIKVGVTVEFKGGPLPGPPMEHPVVQAAPAVSVVSAVPAVSVVSAAVPAVPAAAEMLAVTETMTGVAVGAQAGVYVAGPRYSTAATDPTDEEFQQSTAS